VNKHYVTLKDGFIVDGFSDAFRQPQDTDVCINEDAGRQFTLNGLTNPQLKDEDGFALYKADGTRATQAEQEGYTEFTAVKERAAFKVVRDATVQAAIVTTSLGNTFDADEKSQERMARAILIAQATGQESTWWVMEDNSTKEITLSDMIEALALAGQAQSEAWFA